MKFKATIWKTKDGERSLVWERKGFASAAEARGWATDMRDRAEAQMVARGVAGVRYEKVIGEESDTDALAHLRAVIAAYREPHYGDKDAQLDNVHTAVEAAEIWLKEQEL